MYIHLKDTEEKFMNSCIVELDLGMLGMVEADVEYSIDGGYYPATRDMPAEFPTLDVDKVVVNLSGVLLDVKDELCKDELELVEDLVKEAIDF